MNFTKLDQADLDSPRRELSNGGLKIVVALKIFRELIFCVFLLGVRPIQLQSEKDYVPNLISDFVTMIAMLKLKTLFSEYDRIE